MRTPRDVHGSEAVVVPMHEPIKPGTLRGLVEQAGVSMEEFIDAL